MKFGNITQDQSIKESDRHSNSMPSDGKCFHEAPMVGAEWHPQQQEKYVSHSIRLFENKKKRHVSRNQEDDVLFLCVYYSIYIHAPSKLINLMLFSAGDPWRKRSPWARTGGDWSSQRWSRLLEKLQVILHSLHTKYEPPPQAENLKKKTLRFPSCCSLFFVYDSCS